VDAVKFKNELNRWKNALIYGGFSRENDELCAYAMVVEYPEHADFCVLRANPLSERLGINAAMVSCIVESYNDKLGKNYYINDGTRSIRHETAFQDYLEKYFEFRKAYCKFHIKYRFPIGIAVNILYPFRNRINKNRKIGSAIYALLKMEEINKTFV
jgi:hypothetical protein